MWQPDFLKTYPIWPEHQSIQLGNWEVLNLEQPSRALSALGAVLPKHQIKLLQPCNELRGTHMHVVGIWGHLNSAPPPPSPFELTFLH